MEQTQQQPQIQPQAEQKPQFPTEEVTLPSKGLLYPEGSPLKSGKIRMKYINDFELTVLSDINNKEVEEITSTDNKIKSYAEKNNTFTKNFNIFWKSDSTPKILKIYNLSKKKAIY